MGARALLILLDAISADHKNPKMQKKVENVMLMATCLASILC